MPHCRLQFKYKQVRYQQKIEMKKLNSLLKEYEQLSVEMMNRKQIDLESNPIRRLTRYFE